jgi:putative ABC transport system permease protein
MLFTAAISIGAGVLFGLAPALRARDVMLHDSLKEGARSGESRAGSRLRDALVTAQFALAFALLAGAGLMIQTMWNLRQTELGFRADHLLTMEVPLPAKKYDTDDKKRNFFRQAAENVRAMPGVKGAGFASDAPFTTEGDTNGYSRRRGSAGNRRIQRCVVSRNYPGILGDNWRDVARRALAENG